ncbi:MAG: glycosyl hydrolase, partial [Phycisphaerae bacterium]|nr:glycosyl hydrolase [Phycisphaerae bacterium]
MARTMRKRSSVLLLSVIALVCLSASGEVRAGGGRRPAKRPLCRWRAQTPEVFTTDQKVRIEVELKNLSPTTQEGLVQYTIKDYYGTTVTEKRKMRVKIEAGKSHRLTIVPKTKMKGLFGVHCRFAGAEEAEIRFNYALLDPVPDKNEVDPESPFGFGVYPARHHEQGEKLIKLAQLAGVRSSRHEFYWVWIETQKGKFQLGKNKSVEQQTSHGMDIMGMLAYTTFWATATPKGDGFSIQAPPKHMADFENFVFHTVQRYKERVKSWEMWNEPNSKQFWMPRSDPKQYAELCKAGYTGAKRADPNCTVVGFGVFRTDYRFIESAFKQGAIKHMDVISVHPYRYPLAPEDTFLGLRPLDEELLKLKKLIDKYSGGKKKPIWLTEIGWATHRGFRGVSLNKQADYIVRMYVLALSVPTVEKIFWYNFRNFGTSKTYNEHNFGLLFYDLRPKPSYV